MTYRTLIAFCGDRKIAEGSLGEVARAIKPVADSASEPTILIFDARTSEPVEIDLRGSIEDVLARLPEQAHDHGPADTTKTATGDNEPPRDESNRGPGRPKLGVIAREVTLLPRHWEWLAVQPGGASVTLRKLVEDARKAHGAQDRTRAARETTYRFASAIAGNRPNYEEAMRALFAGDSTRFEEMTEAWPADIRDHVRRLSGPAFET